MSVRRSFTRQSSCAHPAKRLRVTSKAKSVLDLEWNTHRVIGVSGCRFHVDGSFQTGNSASRLAGTGPPVASTTPMQRRHQRKSL